MGNAIDDRDGGGSSLPFTPASGIRKGKYKWIWQGRIACPSICLLAGRGGTGKSTLAAAIAASVTGGRPLPEGPDKGRVKGAVMWLCAEESASAALVPRLKAAGCRLNRVLLPGLARDGQTNHVLQLASDLGAIRDLAEYHGVRLIVVDPLAAYCGGIDLNQQVPVRGLFASMKLVGEACNLSWLLIAHPNKSRTGPILDRIFGSSAIPHCARSTLLCGMHPDGDGSRVIVHAKTNEGVYADTLAFQLSPLEGENKPPVVDWIGPTAVTAEMLGMEPSDAGEQDEHIDAQLLLRSLVADWRPFNDILAEAKIAGVGERTLRKAKKSLGVLSRRVDDGFGRPHWEWGPPENGFKESKT